MKREWWQKPGLRTDEEDKKHRPVTWLELFFDLVFVVVIARLSHNLVGDVTAGGLFVFLFMFVPVWWIWNGVTYYNERFESEGVEMRFFTFLTMIPVAGLAALTIFIGLNPEPFVQFAERTTEQLLDPSAYITAVLGEAS